MPVRNRKKEIKGLFLLSIVCLQLAVGHVFAQQNFQIMLPLGHSQSITEIKFSNDGKYFATASYDQSVKLWDAQTGSLIKTFTGHQDVVQAVAFSNNGRLLASGGEDEQVIIWDLTTGDSLHVLTMHDDDVYALLFSSDDKTLYIAGDHYFEEYLREVDVQTGEQLRIFEGEVNGLYDIVFDPKTGNIISAGMSYALTDWDITSGKEMDSFVEHEEEILDIDISDNGMLLSADYDGELILWDWNTKSVLWREFIADGETIEYLDITPDGKYAVTTSYGEINVIEVQSQKIIRKLEIESAIAAISDNGQYIFFEREGSGIVERFDIRTGQFKKMGKVSNPDIPYTTAYNESDNRLFVGMADGSVTNWYTKGSSVSSIKISQDRVDELWYLQPTNELLVKSKKLYKYPLDNPAGMQTLDFGEAHTEELYDRTFDKYYFIDYSKQANILSYAIKDQWNVSQIKLTDFTNIQKVFSSDLKAGEVALSPDGTLFAKVQDENLSVYSMRNGEEVFRLKAGNTLVSGFDALTFGPQSSNLYVIDSDFGQDSIEVWDLASKSLEEVYLVKDYFNGELVVSETEKYIAVSEENAIQLFYKDLGSSKLLMGQNGYVSSIKFMENDTYLVSTTFSGMSQIWEVETGEVLLNMVSFNSGRDWLVITPDGRFDGTSTAMNELYITQGLTVLPIASFFEEYYTPGLLAQVLSGQSVESSSPSLSQGFSIPPNVEISSSEYGTTSSKQISVTVTAIDQGGGIDELKLYHNGKVVSDDQRGLLRKSQTNSQTKTYQVSLVAGENVFTATAFNQDRIESIPASFSISLTEAAASSKLFVISVGLNEYRNSVLNLNYGRPDAQAFVGEIREASQNIFSAIQVVEVYDENATKPGIVSAFEQVKAQARPEDVFIFFYAGHGVMTEITEDSKGDFFIVPYDVTQLYGNPYQMEQKGISAAELKAYSSQIPALKQLVFLDACQSGGAIETFAMRGAAEQKAIAQLSRSTGQVVLAAAGSEQFAAEFSELGHGVFTYALLEGLKGFADGGSRDGKITVNELSAYLEDLVPELTEKYRGQSQFPNRYGYGQDFPIAISNQ